MDSNDSTTTKGGKQGLTAEEFVEKLKTALRRDGDFPASAKVVNELRVLTSDPNSTANQITEIILREPSLGTRVLSLVNSSYYRRAKPVMTISQAVVQIGMKPLAELCAGLILLQKFVPMARRGGAFATCLQKTIVTSLLSSSLTDELVKTKGRDKSTELGYLAGSFSEMGSLLLAFYFPEIYESAVKRSETKNQDLGKSIKELTGLTPMELSVEVVKAAELPDFYKDILTRSQNPGNLTVQGFAPEEEKINKIAKSLYAASEISSVVLGSNKKQDLDKVIKKMQSDLGIDAKIFDSAVTELSSNFNGHCATLELSLPSLPGFMTTYKSGSSVESAPELISTDAEAEGEKESFFSQFLEEIRQAVENQEPTASIVTTVMETLAWSLKFDRVLLLLVTEGKKKLLGRMLLGSVEGFDPKTFQRPLGKEAGNYAPDSVAFAEARPVYLGDPIFKDGWPLVAIPIGFGSRAIGVIYADRVSGTKEINERERAAIGMLAELLDRSVGPRS